MRQGQKTKGKIKVGVAALVAGSIALPAPRRARRPSAR